MRLWKCWSWSRDRDSSRTQCVSLMRHSWIELPHLTIDGNRLCISSLPAIPRAPRASKASRTFHPQTYGWKSPWARVPLKWRMTFNLLTRATARASRKKGLRSRWPRKYKIMMLKLENLMVARKWNFCNSTPKMPHMRICNRDVGWTKSVDRILSSWITT